ncbi:MAG TPA: hypothetical protein VK784_14445 [Pseudonocardiaceae bacterium]|nr:hypothetical protein [Pseudonocardiaceae bacterium]
MSGPVLVLGIVDTSTGYRHFVAAEVVPLHRRSGRYPALCGEVIAATRRTVSGCASCDALRAGQRPRRLSWARRVLIATDRGRG